VSGIVFVNIQPPEGCDDEMGDTADGTRGCHNGGASVSDSRVVLTMSNVSKAFPGVQALDKVTFECTKGEVHALVGENGAGKSTLMKVLCGAYTPDSGTIVLDGHEVHIRNPRHAQELGISIIYQELNLEPYMDIAENIFLGREPLTKLRTVDYPRMYEQANELMRRVGMDIDATEWIVDIPLAQRQMIEIAKALSLDAKVVVMDEPTSALSLEETDRLFEIIKSLQEQGITVIYISHRIREIFRIADRVTVLKDGCFVGTESVKGLTEDKLVRMMIGRSLDQIFPEKGQGRGQPVLSVRGLTRAGAFEDVSFDLYEGEVLGLAGLVGAGRTEVVRAIFGADEYNSGEISIDGKPVRIRSPQDATRSGIGLVPEDRRKSGLVLCLSVRSNTVLAVLKRTCRAIFASEARERDLTNDLIATLDVKTPSCEHEVEFLSGGNQQKVVLAKWLAADPRVIMFDEPTRGIDVGAKSEVHHLMRELANKGTAILMVSSELPEILGMSDRILVMCQGRITGLLPASEANEENLMLAATGLRTFGLDQKGASPQAGAELEGGVD
jgi:ribose transport system ATP-binding protein